MNEWLLAALILTAALVPLAFVAAFGDVVSGLVAVEVGSSVACAILVLLSEGTHRQSFVDLALVLAPLSLIGSIAYARLMERHL